MAMTATSTAVGMAAGVASAGQCQASYTSTARARDSGGGGDSLQRQHVATNRSGGAARAAVRASLRAADAGHICRLAGGAAAAAGGGGGGGVGEGRNHGATWSTAFLKGAAIRVGVIQRNGSRSSSRRGPGSRVVQVRAEKDYYSILGVSRSSEKAEIKSAYRQLARKYHPDVNKEAGAEQRFKEISNAYEVLSDDEKRSLYDRFGEAGVKGAAGMGGANMDFTNPFDIFETFFNGMGGMGGASGRAARSRPTQGDDERYDITLDFREAVFGADKEIECARLEACGTCNGSGARPGTNPSTCSVCGGQGQVVSLTQTPLGSFQQVTTCPQCKGSGEISTPCVTCGGDGRVRKTKRISLKVPAGVDSGSRLRVRGEGNAGRRGGPPGDLYVFINVRSDPELKRDGNNILVNAKIFYTDAILGTVVKVPTVDGAVDLKIPAGTQPGTTLVMAKRGVPTLGKPSLRGDQLIKVQVEIPRRLSSDERKLVEELAELTKSSKSAGTRR